MKSPHIFKNDYYLSKRNFYNRLKKEYYKYGKLIIAFDFDDTVYDFHKKGRSYKKIINLLQEWQAYSYLILYTASDESRYESMKSHLMKNEIYIDAINENISKNVPQGGKIYYNVFLDDRAGLNTSYWALKKLIRHIKRENKKCIKM